MRFRDAVVAAQIALRLVPEILDPVDVVTASYERLAMVDPAMVEF